MTKREKAVSEAASTLAAYFRFVARTGRVDPSTARLSMRLLRIISKPPAKEAGRAKRRELS